MNRQKLPSSTTPLSYDASAQRNPREYLHAPYISRVLAIDSWPTFLSLIVWVLSSFKFAQWAPKGASFLQQRAYWPFKVVQGHPRSIILVPIKSTCGLPISLSLWLWSYLAPFLRYRDLLAKNGLFLLPVSHSVPPLPILPLEFCGEVNHEETRVMGLSYSE